MKTKYKCLYEITGCIEDVATFLVPIADLPKQEQGEPVGEMQLSAIYEGMVVPVVSVELPAGTKLYTTPQQRKPLTDEEVVQIRDDMTLDIRSHVDFCKHCEAKLKEKNGIAPQADTSETKGGA